MGEQVPEK